MGGGDKSEIRMRNQGNLIQLSNMQQFVVITTLFIVPSFKHYTAVVLTAAVETTAVETTAV